MSPTFVADTLAELRAPADRAPERFDPATLEELPEAAQRWLATAIPRGAPLVDGIELSMEGHIKLGPRWFPFRADQTLRHGVGLVWSAVVGGRLVRFVGADAVGGGGALLEFRLHDRVPIVRASGADVLRSGAGRLAAETVAWLPHAATPQAGASWRAGADGRATVTLGGPSGPVEVEITVGDDGRVRELSLQRWKDGADPPAFAPFGGEVLAVRSVDGVEIARDGTVGWEWGTEHQRDGIFFRYRVLAARLLG